MSKPPAWVAEYIGMRFRERGRDRAGCDCWGLVRLVLAERFGVEVPSYAGDYDTVGEQHRIAALITRHQPAWLPVDPGRERPGDVVLLRLHGLPVHVGVVAARGWMLHVEPKVDSVLERFDGLEWRNRVLGVYRHAALQMSEVR
jgi:cell wall-associated NlpC family hydrolase